MGGAHFDGSFKDNKHNENEIGLLAQKSIKLKNNKTGELLFNKSMVYYEILSIGQYLYRSRDLLRMIKKAKELSSKS